MSILSFELLVGRFGEVFAWQCLAEIEKAAGIISFHGDTLDPEFRLSHACWTQDMQMTRVS